MPDTPAPTISTSKWGTGIGPPRGSSAKLSQTACYVMPGPADTDGGLRNSRGKSGAGQGRSRCRRGPATRKLEASKKLRKKECHGIHPSRVRGSGPLPGEGRPGARRRCGRTGAAPRAGALAGPLAVRSRPHAHPGQSTARLPDPLDTHARGGDDLRVAAELASRVRRPLTAAPTDHPADETPGT